MLRCISPWTSWLLPRLPAFHGQFPDVDAHVSTTSRRLRYLGDAFDIGVRSGPEQGTGLVSRMLIPQWLRKAGAPGLRPVRQMEFEHVFLQQAAAVEGLGVTLASLPLIRRGLAVGRLVCPLPATTWRAPGYAMVLNAERESDAATLAFKDWIVQAAAQEPAAPPTS